MLTILDVNPTGYFSFGIHDTINLHELGIVLLEGLNKDRGGSANGAGKTSIFNTITTILFDKNPTHHTGESIVNESLGKSFGKVTFIDGSGDRWRVISTRKWRKTDKYPCDAVQNEPSEWHTQGERYSGTDLYVERWNGNIWADERSTNTNSGDSRLDLKATRKKILSIVGMSYEQFMNVAYLAQQQSLKFVNGTHKERLEVLSELSDIGVWDRRQAVAKEKIKIAESELDRLRSLLDGANRAGIIFSPPDENAKSAIIVSIDSCNAHIADCDTKITNLSIQRTNWLATIETMNDNLNALNASLRALASQRKILESKLNDISRDYIVECNNIRNRPPPSESVDLNNEVNSIRGQIQARRFDMEQLLSGSGKCPRCRSNVTDEHLIRQRELLTMEIKELEANARIKNEKILAISEATELQISSDLDDAENKMTKSKTEVESQMSDLTKQEDKIVDDINNVNMARALLGDDPNKAMNAIINERMNWMASLSHDNEKLNEWVDKASKWTNYKTMLDEAGNKTNELNNQLKYLRAIEKAFGDKGIKAHKLGVVLAMLNKSVQEFADILTDNSVKVWITPFREKADKSLSTDMQIMVQEGEKKNTPFDLYSGGEKQQIVLAFIGAFWQVANMQGSGCSLLCLDEIFGPLDELNAVGVFNYLDHMNSQGKSTILVVTHDNNIKNQLNFDKKWIVEKHNHISKLITDV